MTEVINQRFKELASGIYYALSLTLIWYNRVAIIIIWIVHILWMHWFHNYYTSIITVTVQRTVTCTGRFNFIGERHAECAHAAALEAACSLPNRDENNESKRVV